MITDYSQYTDCYFSKTKLACTQNPLVEYQVFQRKQSVLAGLNLILPMFDGIKCEIDALVEGDKQQPWEPTMMIRGHIQDLAELETVYLGILDECTRVATAVRQAKTAAGLKPVLFFPARFAAPEVQFYHGYAAGIGGATGCATKEQQKGWDFAKGHLISQGPVGTMPHAMIAAFYGDTVAASLAFAARFEEPVWALVDFHNDCAKTAVEVFRAFEAKGMANRLVGIRLDTSDKLIDAGLVGAGYVLNSKLHGVCPDLVRWVRLQLNLAGAHKVKICVSGGFTPEKIATFEQLNVPADVYAIGEGFLKTDNAYTSDIVRVKDEHGWNICGKVGRPRLDTLRLIRQV